MTKVNRFKTSFSFPRASLLHGFGSIFNIAGNYFEFKYSETAAEADKKAIADDWKVIGSDIRDAICNLEREKTQ